MTFFDHLFPVGINSVLFIASYLIGRSHSSILWITLFILLYLLIWNAWKVWQRKSIIFDQTSLCEADILLTHLRDLPSWVQFPDSERVEWINKVILQLWPNISIYAKHFLKRIIEPQLQLFFPGPLKLFSFEQMDIGNIPLRVSGIKVYTENVGRDKIILDMNVAYAGDCDFKVSVGVFKGGLKQLQFKGKLRAVLSPLVPKLPIIGAVTTFLLEEPILDFELTGLGELVELPGLMTAIRAVVRAVISSICVVPNEIVVPLTLYADSIRLRFPEADGVLKLFVIQARNLENRDSFLAGKSDPYLIASVGSQNCRTKTVNNNLNPFWNESFEILVDQFTGSRLFVELFDEDVGSKDDFLGRLSLDLSIFKLQSYTDKWYTLEDVKKGEIRLASQWFSLTAEKIETSPTDSIRRAVLGVYIDSVADLPMIKRDLEPSPFIEFSLMNKHDIKRSIVRRKTCHPIYQQRFSFFVEDADQEVLSIEAKDSVDSKRSLGETIVPLKFLLRECDLEILQRKFQLVLGPHTAQAVMSLRLRYLTTAMRASCSAPIDEPIATTSSVIVGEALVRREKHYVKSINSPQRVTGVVQTKTIITPRCE